MSSLIMVVPSFSVNMERLKDGSTIPTLVIYRSVFQSYWGFIPRKVGLLIIAAEGILFQNCKAPTFET